MNGTGEAPARSVLRTTEAEYLPIALIDPQGRIVEVRSA